MKTQKQIKVIQQAYVMPVGKELYIYGDNTGK